MPVKPKRPCGINGCPELTNGRYCEKHEKLVAKNYERYDRDPAMRKHYGRTWRRIRDRYIVAHPLCEECNRHDRITVAEEVHHIISLSKGGTHVNDNLMSLCKPCHSSITARGGDRWQTR